MTQSLLPGATPPRVIGTPIRDGSTAPLDSTSISWNISSSSAGRWEGDCRDRDTPATTQLPTSACRNRKKNPANTRTMPTLTMRRPQNGA
jgi:hypothetical protein